MPIRKPEDFSFKEVKKGDLVKHVTVVPTHEQCTVASCPCRVTRYVKVFSKGPWPELQPKPGATNGEEKCLWGVWGASPEETEQKWARAEEEGTLKPHSEGGALLFYNIDNCDYLEILITYDRAMLVLEDL